MCAHVHVSFRVGEKIQEWTLIPTITPREQLSWHLVAILSHSGLKLDFMEAWRRIQRGSRTERKMYNDPRCHSHDFWTALVTRSVLQRRWRIVSLVMHHKCNTICECSSHTQSRMGNVCTPSRRMHCLLRGSEGHIVWQAS